MNNVQLRVGDLLYAAFKRWKMILALGLLGFICGFALSGVSYLQGNYTSYEISCSIAITSQSSTGAFTNNSSYLSTNDFHLAEDMVDAASFVMKSNRVLQAALDSTGLVSVSTKDVYQNLEVSRYNETQVLQLTLSWNNADAGIRLMNAILDASRTILPETLMVGSVAVIDAPEAKYLMGGGSYASLWIIFSLLGLMAGVGMAVLELLMRPTLVNLKDVEDVLGLETLGNVPKDDGYFQKNTQLLSEKHRSDAEAVQNFASAAYILTNRFGTKEKQHRFYVTSAEDGEGKSTVAANLALQLSDMEKRTLLLDLNTRAPSLGGMFLRSVDYSRTLNALYKGESAAQEAIVSLTGFLDLLPMVLERNAVPLDGTLFELLEKIMEPYEYVVIDASSVGRSSDVLRLNKLANNVLFVVRYDATPLPALQDAIEKLDKSGVRVLGCVVNETQSLGTFQFYPERTAVSNASKKNENTDEKETGGSLPEDLLRPADGQEKAADWKPSGAGSQSVLDELTDDLYQTKGGLSDNEAMWELLRMGKDGSWKQTDPEKPESKASQAQPQEAAAAPAEVAEMQPTEEESSISPEPPVFEKPEESAAAEPELQKTEEIWAEPEKAEADMAPLEQPLPAELPPEPEQKVAPAPKHERKSAPEQKYIYKAGSDAAVEKHGKPSSRRGLGIFGKKTKH